MAGQPRSAPPTACSPVRSMSSRSRTLLDEGVMIAAEEQAQRRAAVRALLAKPLLVADADGETLVLVRRHLPELREWLNRETGWRLVADSETARLFKTAPELSD